MPFDSLSCLLKEIGGKQANITAESNKDLVTVLMCS